MGPGEMAPALPPEPSPRKLPFQAEAGGSQTSKPIWESDVGAATPIARQKGVLTLVVPTVPPSGRYSALSILVLGAMVLPASAAQLWASPWPMAGFAAWLLAASAGSRAATETNVLRCPMRFPFLFW